MFHTLTLNPSIDYTIGLNSFLMGRTNRAASEQISIGGKGINVSIVLKNLGIPSIAHGFTAGFTGQEIINHLQEYGIESRFVMVEHGISRINVKLPMIDGTEINGIGPEISEKEIERCLSCLKNVDKGDVLILSGSIPPTVSNDIYCDIIRSIKDQEILFVIDATGKLLLNTLRYNPFLIKPNIHELEELFDTSISSMEDIFLYSEKLQSMGARNVLISCGEDGAVLLGENHEKYHVNAPKGNVMSSVGAGDSMIAGFMYGWMKYSDLLKALKYGVAAGSATTFSVGLADKNLIDKLYNQLED